jgi:hypothetical protein
MDWSVGSRWLRWDPHLHGPGTLLNDQFGDSWDSFVAALEAAEPAPVALGITDYFTLRTYKEVLNRRQQGVLAGIPLVFPNIEIRLTVETKTRAGVNLHLLICPDDPDHVTLIQEKLCRLTFSYASDVIPCSDEGLIRLGRAHRHDSALPENAALAEGANQFKVDLGQLRNLYENDPWLQSNVLVAVAAGNDGLGGLSQDASFHAHREELGRFAHIVFSANPADRSYWLGDHSDFEVNGQTPKPCLHGCDAHRIEDVLKPAELRRCWLRAEPTFDGLRQSLVEPRRRVHIGEDPPQRASRSNVIRAVSITSAEWLESRVINLNDGLVSIIGAKGSGKTALADLIAYAAFAKEDTPGPASFLAKAGDLLDGTVIELEWADGERQQASIPDESDDLAEPRVRYLSQQFVERLCSARGLAEPLVEEIERVVFSSIPDEDRLQCGSFVQLRKVMLEQPQMDREAEEKAIRAATKQIADETALIKSLKDLHAKAAESQRVRASLDKDLSTMPVPAGDGRIKAQKTAADLAALKEAIASEERRAKDIGDVISEVTRCARQADVAIESVKARFLDLLPTKVWDCIHVKLSDDAISKLTELKRESDARAKRLREIGVGDVSDESSVTRGLAALESEHKLLVKELGLDQAKAKRRVELERKLEDAKKNEAEWKKAVTNAEQASARRKKASSARLASYERVFDALVSEEQVLEGLYSGMKRRIGDDPRLERLSFFVHRSVDLDLWAARGEDLLDLRRPPFQRRGAVAEVAREALFDAWSRGTPSEVRAAMEKFVEQYGAAAFDSLAHGVTPINFGEWLFCTDHIKVNYGIQYEGVEIAHLSPGTRGVVLLTLYLALDEWDERPLVIDQPEENLDPRSIYADLVPFFRDAAQRRQIIMVTHNANLVVNTDSDQVIVAESRRTSPSELPTVRYVAGGLESSDIRSHVCHLLEGGEEAFKKRGQRYGVRARPSR